MWRRRGYLDGGGRDASASACQIEGVVCIISITFTITTTITTIIVTIIITQGMEHFEGLAYRHEEEMLCLKTDECSKISSRLFCK